MLRDHTRAAAAAVLTIAAIAGCSSSPTSPDPAVDRMGLLPEASYMLLVSTSQEQAGACRADPPRPTGLLGLVAIAAITISHDGQTWVARAANAADGDIELRLRHVRDDAVIGGQVYTAFVEGTIRGSVLLPGGGVSLSDRVTFGGAVETRIQGTISRSGGGLGSMTGEIVQSSAAGAVSCPVARWTLSRGQFPGF